MKLILCLLYLMLLVSLSGCFKPSTSPPKTAESSAPKATVEEATPRETINQKTQNVIKLEEALANGAIIAPTNVEASDPISASQGAYRTSIGKLAVMAVNQTIQIRDAQSIKDPKPLSYEEFTTEILKKDQPDGLHFAMLPYYQEYAWDTAGQTLVVVEFPARKEKRREELDNN